MSPKTARDTKPYVCQSCGQTFPDYYTTLCHAWQCKGKAKR